MQKRPIILSILLTEATPQSSVYDSQLSAHNKTIESYLLLLTAPDVGLRDVSIYDTQVSARHKTIDGARCESFSSQYMTHKRAPAIKLLSLIYNSLLLTMWVFQMAVYDTQVSARHKTIDGASASIRVTGRWARYMCLVSFIYMREPATKRVSV